MRSFRTRLTHLTRALACAAVLSAVFVFAAQSRAALVAYYPLDGNVNDVVSGYNGTEIGGPFSYVASPYGMAVDLTPSQYATLTTGTNFGLGGNFTVSAFINSDDLGGDHAILGNDGGSTNNTLHLITRGAQAHFGFFANDQGPSGSLSTNTWTHIAWQFDNGVQRLFVNGVNVGESGGHANFAGTGNIVNLGRWGGGNYFDGRLDEVAIYNTALSPFEIGSLANGADPQNLPPIPPKLTWDFGDTPNLQGWTVLSGGAFFRPDEGGGITAANDSNGFGHDPEHTVFLVESPIFHFNPGNTLDGTNAIMAEFRGGMGDQNGNIGNYHDPSDVLNFQQPPHALGRTGDQGVKALAILDVETGQYLAFLLDPGDGDNNGAFVSLTPAQLQSFGVLPDHNYRLHFFDTDEGGWGWTQFNFVMIAGEEGLAPVPEPASLALLGLGGLAVLRRRRAA